jgi:hypothetical protein
VGPSQLSANVTMLSEVGWVLKSISVLGHPVIGLFLELSFGEALGEVPWSRVRDSEFIERNVSLFQWLCQRFHEELS